MAQHFAVCPFYKHDTEKSIMCEGVEGAKIITIKFESSSMAYLYRRRFCQIMDNYQSCPICKGLMYAWGCDDG